MRISPSLDAFCAELGDFRYERRRGAVEAASGDRLASPLALVLRQSKSLKEVGEMKRLAVLLVVLVAAVVSAVFASTAAAAKPVMSQYIESSSAVLTDACAFPVAVDFTASVTEIDFFDQSGALTRVYAQFVEQDTFSANGKSLTGVPFTFNFQVLFDSSGNITHLFSEGIVEKVPLPDGGLFITAGRVDFAAHGFPTFILTPDVGATVNLAGFCAALSP
jgi:hypothetical protein